MSAMLTRSAGMEYKMPQRELPALVLGRGVSSASATCRAAARVDHRALVEFEYGCTGKPGRARVGRAGRRGTNATGPNANLLDVVYCKVELLADLTFEPIMGVRVRDTNKARSLLGKFGAAMAHPIVGVTNINLTKLVPTYQRIAAERRRCARRRRRRSGKQAEEEEARRATETRCCWRGRPIPRRRTRRVG